MPRRLLPVLAAGLLGACTAGAGPGAGPSAMPAVKPTPAASGAPAASAAPAASTAPAAGRPDPAAILAAYKTDAYVKINQAGINGTSAHTAGRPLFIYVDKAHAASYKKAPQGPMPAGMTIVKVSAEGEDKLVAIMQKLPAGTEPATADWFYWESLGGSTFFDGNKTPGGGICNSCHQGAPASADRLLGTEVFAP